MVVLIAVSRCGTPRYLFDAPQASLFCAGDRTPQTISLLPPPPSTLPLSAVAVVVPLYRHTRVWPAQAHVGEACMPCLSPLPHPLLRPFYGPLAALTDSYRTHFFSRSPRFSPEGRWLAFVRTPQVGAHRCCDQLVLVCDDGGARRGGGVDRKSRNRETVTYQAPHCAVFGWTIYHLTSVTRSPVYLLATRASSWTG